MSPRSMIKKKHRTSRRAVFLDRDGTIVREVDLLTDIKQLRLLPHAAEALRAMVNAGYVLFLVTNQAVVARGLATEREVERVNVVLSDRLEKKGVHIEEIYYCPHHPNANLKRYRVACSCRKPNIGMVTRAVKEHGIDLKHSFFIGDATSDILTGRNAGMKTILVKTGYAGKDGKHQAKPDFIAKDLKEAVRIIKKHGI